VEHFLESIGYPAIFILAFVEAVCIPFPSEITFGYTGALAAEGHFSLVLIIVIGVVGEISGSIFAWYVGKTGGRAIIDRYGKYALLSKRDLDRTEKFMARRGDSAVLIGRLIPLLRAFVSLLAGIAEMSAARFALFTTIGTTIYCTTLAVVGYELGSTWHRIVKGFTYTGIVVVVLAVLAIAVLVLHRLRQLRAERIEPGPPS
jgi:membrane protein DedA with SNARE-associated domain